MISYTKEEKKRIKELEKVWAELKTQWLRQGWLSTLSTSDAALVYQNFKL
jgi:hypothetical protein